MKKVFSCLALVSLLGSSQAFAYFQCDYDFDVLGHTYPVWIQLENFDGEESIVFREKGSKEGTKEGVVMVLKVVEKTKTRIGNLIRATITENGQTAHITVKLPDVLPGRGSFQQGDDSSTSVGMSCRRK